MTLAPQRVPHGDNGDYALITPDSLPLRPYPMNKEWLDKYLNEKALDVLKNFVSIEKSVVNGVEHNTCAIIVQCFGEITEGKVKKFCENINTMVNNGDLSVGCMTSPLIIPLIQLFDKYGNKKPERSLFMFYGMSRKSLDELKTKYRGFFKI